MNGFFDVSWENRLLWSDASIVPALMLNIGNSFGGGTLLGSLFISHLKNMFLVDLLCSSTFEEKSYKSKSRSP